MILPKIRRKSCVCNLFFCFAVTLSFFAFILSAQGQQSNYTSPFLQSASGATNPVLPVTLSAPTLISSVKSWGITASFSPSPFGIAELGYADLLAVHRFSDIWSGGIGLSGSGATSLYNEFCGSLLSAVNISEDIVLGAACEYSQISLRSFGTQRQLQADLGISMRIDSSIIAAASFDNILRSAFGVSAVIRQEARFGIGVTASEQWTFDADIRINEHASIEAGALFAPISKTKFRLGYSSLLQAIELFPAFAVSDESRIFARLQWSNLLGFSQQIGVLWLGQ